ncbi:MAG: nitrile hydratase subunit beta [Chloroflexi bacterium]|nr:nitrile hydratase subunit beta [Chloroflexota bacterium]
MNGVHDMGGMHGFGPIQPEENAPVLHSPWEAAWPWPWKIRKPTHGRSSVAGSCSRSPCARGTTRHSNTTNNG